MKKICLAIYILFAILNYSVAIALHSWLNLGVTMFLVYMIAIRTNELLFDNEEEGE